MTPRLRAAALSTAIAVVALVSTVAPAVAHHGWSWTTGGNIELTGIIREARLGNPHGVLKVDADGEIWTVEVGQPWRNAQAGLLDGDLAVGVEITAVGEPAADVSQKLMKAEVLVINGNRYPLYPNRN